MPSVAIIAETFDTTDVVVGSGGDTGLDGVAIIINGALVTDVDQVADLVDTNSFLDATFIFVQAERSAKFDGAKIGTFGYGAVDFFSNTPKLDRNKQINACVEIMEAIYEKSSMFKRGNPICRLYYVTSGKWTDDVNLEGRRATATADLEELNIFRDVSFLPVDSDGIRGFYSQTKNAVSREITFSKWGSLPFS